jgi:predicted nuclease with TOPRIM domain
MLDNQTRKKLEEIIKERIDMIKNSDEAYIYVNAFKEKITSIEIIRMGITERVKITTNREHTLLLTLAQFLTKTIEIKKDGKKHKFIGS